MQSQDGLKAVIYLRVSTTKQVTEGYGLETQEERCRALAIAKAWKVIGVYKDEGISGTLDENTGREELKRAIDDAEKKIYDAFIFFSLDRLGRTAAIVLNTVNVLAKKGIKLASCKEFIDTSTPHGVFMLNIFAALSELERSTIVDRLASGKKYRIEKIDGECGGDLIWGYSRQDGKIIVNEKAAEIINEIYVMFYEKDMYINKIVENLNNRHILSPKGKVWYPNTVSNILKKYKSAYEGGPRNNTKFNWPRLLNKNYEKND
jgi:site-specific DNA recombinase